MRGLIVDHYYDAVTAWIYAANPGLDRADYATQLTRVHDALFGQTAFQVEALRALGHEASDSLVNVRQLQLAWAREHGVRLSPASRWAVRRRRGWLPWPKRRPEGRWMGQALLAQVSALKPDFVLIESMDLLGPSLVADIRAETRLVVGQVATELPTDRTYGSYDLVVSSIPDLVDRFRRDGGDAEWLPLAFEPSLVDRVPRVERDIDVSFVGSFSSRYDDRAQIIEAVARSTPLQTWTGDAAALPTDSAIRPTIQGLAWGRGMFEVLARSRITVNTHGRISGNAANNLRLFEGTGMGALLVTDARSNMGELFDVGREVVTYRDAREAAEVVAHFIANPGEASAIAAAGQRRTLRDHTWVDRMGRLVDMVRRRV